MDRETHIVTLPVAYQAVYDVFGNPIEAEGASGKELEVTLAPLFIEWID